MEPAFTKSTMLLYALARHGIVEPGQIQELDSEQIEQLAASMAREVGRLKNQRLWSPLHAPEKDQAVTIGNRLYEPKKALQLSVARLELPRDVIRTLIQNHITTLGRLVALDHDGVKELKGSGAKLYSTVIPALRQAGLRVAENDPFDRIYVRFLEGRQVREVSANAELAGMFFPFRWLKMSWLATSLELSRLKGIRRVPETSTHTTKSISQLVSGAIPEVKLLVEPEDRDYAIKHFIGLLLRMAAFAEDW